MGQTEMNTMICGAPGSGKTTYVREHMRSGDLVIDQDAIFHALSGRPWYDNPQSLFPLVLACRDWLIGMAGQARIGRADWYGAWLVCGAARLAERHKLASRFKADKVIVLEVSTPVCIQHISKDPRRDAHQWVELVQKWWRLYEPDENDVKIKDGG